MRERVGSVTDKGWSAKVRVLSAADRVLSVPEKALSAPEQVASLAEWLGETADSADSAGGMGSVPVGGQNRPPSVYKHSAEFRCTILPKKVADRKIVSR